MRPAASVPPEERGLARDGVRMLVATPDGLAHAAFGDLPRYLSAGDLLVVNTSATLAAAVAGQRRAGTAVTGAGRPEPAGQPVTVHFSTPLGDGTWLVELRDSRLGRVRDGQPGETVRLPGGASVTLQRRYPDPAADRLWTASVRVARPADPRPDATGLTAALPAGDLAGDVAGYLAEFGRPIRYSYVPLPWPLAAYQTVFSREPGSAEMPSAGRPFTTGLVTDLVAAGITLAPVTLHAGVGSLEAGEQPLPERFMVPEPTAALVNLTRSAGHRVVAVGTTVTRALESAADAGGTVRASAGWTGLVLGPEPPARPARVVTGLITGWHDPEASHLALLEAVAGPRLVSAAYAEADKQGYLGHEFGDSCLLLPVL